MDREQYRKQLISDLRAIKAGVLAERKVSHLKKINKLLRDLGDDRFTEQENAEIKLLAEKAVIRERRDRERNGRAFKPAT